MSTDELFEGDDQPFTMPDRIAIDAKGYGWRVWDDEPNWSMVPVNPDNSPTPEPVTWFVKRDECHRCNGVGVVPGATSKDAPEWCPTCVGLGFRPDPTTDIYAFGQRIDFLLGEVARLTEFVSDVAAAGCEQGREYPDGWPELCCFSCQAAELLGHPCADFCPGDQPDGDCSCGARAVRLARADSEATR